MIKPFAGPPCGGFLRRDRMTGTRRSAEGRLYLCKNEWDMETEWDLIVRLCVAGLCGTVIGLDREYRVKDAGFRTHFLVALGSALMMIVSQYGFEGFLATHDGLRLDPSRIAAQVVSGIGFIGAGTIIIHRQLVRGLTTAASLWATAGIGLAAGAPRHDRHPGQGAGQRGGLHRPVARKSRHHRRTGRLTDAESADAPADVAPRRIPECQ